MNVLDLFSGIGGFSLGLERAGMRTVAFCEINPFARHVIAKHWPTVPCYDDIRTLTYERLAANAATGDIQIDVICGGFPCQDVSFAGRRLGLDGERSGLWSEYARLIGEIRPKIVIVENTPGLLSLGMGIVLADLAALRYDAEWHCIPACAVGADHLRDRVWIIAWPSEAYASNVDGEGQLQRQRHVKNQRRRAGDGFAENASDSGCSRLPGRSEAGIGGTQTTRYGSWIRLAIKSANDFPREHWNHKPVLGRRLHGVSDGNYIHDSLGSL